MGCIAFGERESHLDGRVRTTWYVGDLKVHPEHRDAIVAGEICRCVANAMRRLADDTPVLITVLAGNGAMNRRLDGPRGLPAFTRVATIRTPSVSILWKRGWSLFSSSGDRQRSKGATIRRAAWSDIDEM